LNEGLTIRTSRQPGQRYMPKMLEHVQNGELDPSFLASHHMSLEDAPRGYELFKDKQDGWVRAVFAPSSSSPARSDLAVGGEAGAVAGWLGQTHVRLHVEIVPFPRRRIRSDPPPAGLRARAPVNFSLYSRPRAVDRTARRPACGELPHFRRRVRNVTE
jgi:hypothetical protein